MNVTNLQDHQIDLLVADVIRLEQAGGSDSAALLRIRSIVSKEMEGDNMEVTTAALGRLPNESCANRLLNIVSYCSEHFLVGSQLISAVALPVSICIRSLNRQPMSLTTGERGALKELAQQLCNVSGAHSAVFDTRLYRGADLFHMKSRAMRAFLMQLGNGTLYPQGGPTALKVNSDAAGQWQLAYFLGVEFTDKPKYPALNDWPVQMHSRAWLDYPSAAIECADSVLFNADVQVQAESHGAFYLTRALEAGVIGNRALRITEMLMALEVDGWGLNIYLCDAGLKRQVRTLMVCPLIVLERKWELLYEETIWDFQCEIERLALDLMQEFEPQCLQLLELEEYERLALKHQVPLFKLLGTSD